MSWGEASWIVEQLSSDKIASNDLLFLMDYKQYGEEAGVYQNKDVLKSVLMTWYAINDLKLRKEAVISADSNGQVGKLLVKQYGINLPQLTQYATLDAIKNTTDVSIANEFYAPDGKFRWLFDDEILTDSFYTEPLLILLAEEKYPVVTAASTKFRNLYGDEIKTSVDRMLYIRTLPGEWWNGFNDQTFLSEAASALADRYVTKSNSRSVTNTSHGLVTGPTISDVTALISTNLKATNGSSVSQEVRLNGKTISRGVSSNSSSNYNVDSTIYYFEPTDTIYQITYGYADHEWYPAIASYVAVTNQLKEIT